MNKRPTVHDVAAHAGVSIKTVSRVVNGSASVGQMFFSKASKVA